MIDEEKQDLEDELKSSNKSKDDLESFKNIFNLVNDSKNIKLNPDYIQMIIPEFRGRLEQRRKRSIFIKYGYAIAMICVAVLGYSIITKVLNENKDIQTIYSNLTTDEVDYLANDMNIDFENDYNDNSFARIDSLYNIKLIEDVNVALSNKSVKSISQDIDIKDLDKYLSDRDIDQIYAELSDKKIL
jgi:hypothetical protein